MKNMNIKYFVTFIAAILTSLSAYGGDELCVIFPDTTNLVFTVPIDGKTGERPYDAFLEYPTEYEDGRPTKFERTGLGYYIHIEVIEETDAGVLCKLKMDHHNLSDMIPYPLESSVVFQPALSSVAPETELTLPIGKWFSLDCTGLKGSQPLSFQFKYQRNEESQQGGGEVRS